MITFNINQPNSFQSGKFLFNILDALGTKKIYFAKKKFFFLLSGQYFSYARRPDQKRARAQLRGNIEHQYNMPLSAAS